MYDSTDQDGTTNNLVLYIMVPWYRMIHQKRGGRFAGYGLEKERNRCILILSKHDSSPRVAFVVPNRHVARRRRCTACRPAAPCHRRADACCRCRAACHRTAPCCCCAASRHPRAALSCRPSPSFFRIVVPLIAVLPPVAVIVPHVAVLPLAIVVPPVAVVVLRRRVARRPRFAASSCRSSPSL